MNYLMMTSNGDPMTLSALKDLERRLSEAKGPDRELERDLYEALTGKCTHREEKSYFIEDGNDYDSGFTCVKCGIDMYGERGKWPLYLHSVDAAIALAEAVLPGCVWHVMTDYGDLNRGKIGPAGASIYVAEDQPLFQQADAATPALSLTLAVVRALIAKKETE
jgi:hypothetical protein